jgi:hypothetical protein
MGNMGAGVIGLNGLNGKDVLNNNWEKSIKFSEMTIVS